MSNHSSNDQEADPHFLGQKPQLGFMDVDVDGGTAPGTYCHLWVVEWVGARTSQRTYHHSGSVIRITFLQIIEESGMTGRDGGEFD